MNMPASRNTPILLVLVVAVCFAGAALGQAANADYTNDLPSVDRVKGEIKGSDPTDTLARQVAVFTYLSSYVSRIKYNRTVRGPFTPGETRVVTAYNLAAYQISQDYAKSHTADEAKAFERLHGQYEMDSSFYADWSKRLIGAQSAAAYKDAENQLAAGQRAHVAQEQQQYQKDVAAQRSTQSGTANDPTTVATRRCLELGGDSTACLGKGLVSGILGLVGADSLMASLPSRVGMVLIGNYRSQGSLPTINFSSTNASIVNCGKLADDSRGYTIHKSGNAVQVVLANQSNDIVLNMHSDLSLTGPGPINVNGQIITGYTTTTKRLLVDGQPAYGPSYNCVGPCAATTTTPVYGPATQRCTIGSFTPPPSPAPASASASSPDSGIFGAITSMIGTVAPVELPGLRLVGQYSNSPGMILSFDGSSVTLDCGQAHVKAPYTVEDAPAQFLIHVQNDGGPFTLAVAPDNTLRGSGSTAVNGRLVSGMNGDNVTFTPHSERCSLDTFAAKSSASSATAVAGSPSTPAKAPAAIAPAPASVPPSTPAGVKIAISTSFPSAPNLLAGKLILLMTDRFDNMMRNIGAPTPAGTTPGQALQAWSYACTPPKDCKAVAGLMAKYYVGRATIDSSGRAILTAPVPPGHYYLFGSAKGSDGVLVWDLPTDLKAGDNAVTLTPANAEVVR